MKIEMPIRYGAVVVLSSASRVQEAETAEQIEKPACGMVETDVRLDRRGITIMRSALMLLLS